MGCWRRGKGNKFRAQTITAVVVGGSVGQLFLVGGFCHYGLCQTIRTSLGKTLETVPTPEVAGGNVLYFGRVSIFAWIGGVTSQLKHCGAFGKQHLCFESAFQAGLLKSQLSVSFVPRREEDRRDPMPSGQKCQQKENTGQLRKKKGR